MYQNITWSNNTLILYICIILSATIFAFASRSVIKADENGIINIKINKILYSISFIILWFFMAFSVVGADHKNYMDIFNNSRMYLSTTNIEKGYLFFNAIIRSLTNNYYVFTFIESFILLYLVYSTLYKLSNYIHIGWAILAFTTLFYFQAYDLKRIYLAMAIIFFGVRYIINKKYIKYLCCIIIAMTIHLTSVFLLIPIFVYFILKNVKSNFLKTLIFLIMIMVLYFFRFQILVMSLPEQYSHYTVITNNKLGFAQIFYILPIVWLFYYSRNWKLDKELKNILLIFTLTSFLAGSLGYFIEAIGRLQIYFTYPYMILVPYIFQNMKCKFNLRKINGYSIIKFVFLLYFGLRIGIYFSEYLVVDQIMPYKNVFGWIF